MIEEIIAMLDTLDGNLRSLWEIYVGHQPRGWLSNVEHIRAGLQEAIRFLDELSDLRSRVADIRRAVADSPHFNPIRKEN